MRTGDVLGAMNVGDEGMSRARALQGDHHDHARTPMFGDHAASRRRARSTTSSDHHGVTHRQRPRPARPSRSTAGARSIPGRPLA